MKKLFYALSFFMLFNLSANAQFVLNSSFENWTTDTAYENPMHFQTMNLQSYFSNGTGNSNKSLDAHQGIYSARIESIQYDTIVRPGLISNGIFNGQSSTGGTPYTNRPDTAFIWVKYNIMAGDTAAVGFFFKKMGNTYGMGFQYITGQQNTWTRIVIPINYGGAINPDSVVFMALSSIPDSNPASGSVLYIDDIQFSNGAPSIPNGDFENWIPVITEQPNDWFTYDGVNLVSPNPHIERSNDAYDGNYSILMSTTLIYGDTFAVFSNSDKSDHDLDKGRDIPWDPMKLTGRYKYIPQGSDTAIVGFRTSRWDASQSNRVILEQSIVKLTQATNWMPFEIDFLYNSHTDPVDTLMLAFASSNIFSGQAYVMNGSKLWIDSLNIVLYPLGLPDGHNSSNKITIYPNPANDIVNFKFEGDLINTSKNIIIYDALSRIVMELKSSQTMLYSVDISNLKSGVYFYIIESNNTISKGKFSVK